MKDPRMAHYLKKVWEQYNVFPTYTLMQVTQCNVPKIIRKLNPILGQNKTMVNQNSINYNKFPYLTLIHKIYCGYLWLHLTSMLGYLRILKQDQVIRRSPFMIKSFTIVFKYRTLTKLGSNHGISSNGFQLYNQSIIFSLKMPSWPTGHTSPHAAVSDERKPNFLTNSKFYQLL